MNAFVCFRLVMWITLSFAIWRGLVISSFWFVGWVCGWLIGSFGDAGELALMIFRVLVGYLVLDFLGFDIIQVFCECACLF